ncbi:hypothetical protein Mal35_51070 [Gimesia maris]|uniref:hypothetical protein n=1 Tax=Gimesia maris TaxID=122 RepID=UPI00118D3F37|nr:hypothetical protein [Gimesia maris]QDT81623.1 hypothetical protein Mal35_51070 [Gimesia maris]
MKRALTIATLACSVLFIGAIETSEARPPAWKRARNHYRHFERDYNRARRNYRHSYNRYRNNYRHYNRRYNRGYRRGYNNYYRGYRGGYYSPGFGFYYGF